LLPNVPRGGSPSKLSESPLGASSCNRSRTLFSHWAWVSRTSLAWMGSPRTDGVYPLVLMGGVEPGALVPELPGAAGVEGVPGANGAAPGPAGLGAPLDCGSPSGAEGVAASDGESRPPEQPASSAAATQPCRNRCSTFIHIHRC